MATSNSFDYSMTFSNILTDAMENIGAIESGETFTAEEQTTGLRTFNMMVKQWSGNFDFAPGLKVFSVKRGYVFLQTGQSVYSLGPSGDNATLSYDQTTIRVAASATATTLEVTSTTGMTAADKIGIQLDSGAIYWTTITSVTDSDTVVIPAPGLSGDAAIGRQVYSYTTKLIRPLYIENAIIRDSSGNDSPIYPMTQGEYESIPAKTDDGEPLNYLYENTLINGTLRLDVEPNDTSKVLRLTFMAPAEDYDTVTDDLAFPQEWYLALSWGLSKLLAPKFGKSWSQDLESNFNSALAIARTSYAETTDVYFQPNVEGHA